MSKIVSTPTIIRGNKRISGTRISVDLVYDYMKEGKLQQFRMNYPHISDEQIDAALTYLLQTLQRQRKKLGSQTTKI